MKKTFFLVVIIFSIFKANACSCTTPKPILEFQTSTYVFEGEIISKVYAKDSLTYTITFNISKHYKKSDNPKTMKFTLESEGKYTGEWTSCDWTVTKNEIWLVYANYRKGTFVFDYFCSNSKPIEKGIIPTSELKILNNANGFEIDKYTFTSLDGHFTNTKPKINLDSILKKYSHKDYGKNYRENRVDIVVDIDKNGQLIASNLTSIARCPPDNMELIDSIYNLNKPKNIALRKANTKFEKDIFQVVKNLKVWEKTYIEGVQTPVRIRKFLQFYKKRNKIEVCY